MDTPNSVAPVGAQSRPPIFVFIHGFLDGAIVWDEVVGALGKRAADAVCVDLPGMGKRADEGGPYSLDRVADEVVRGVNALNRPVILVGHSMGAQIAELAAGRLDGRIHSLVLLTPIPLQGTGMPEETMQSFHELGGNPQAQRELRVQYSVHLDDAHLEKLGRLGDLVKSDSVGEFADIWNRGHPLGTQDSQYRGPVLIVGGDGDALITSEIIAGSVKPRFVNPTVTIIGKAGHWPHVEQPDSVAATLDAFLAAIEPCVVR